MNSLLHWENLFSAEIALRDKGDDPAHDLLHFQRVVNLAGC